MMKIKVGKTMISILLAFCFIFSMTTASALSNNSNASKEFMNIVDNAKIRKVEYYENGNLDQVAILFKDTNNIYLYDEKNIALKTSIKAENEKDILVSNDYTAKYNMSEFLTISKVPSSVSTKSVTYSYLQSKTMTYGGETYRRYLYGGTDMREYLTRSWHFNAGTAVSVISAALGILFPGVTVIAAIVGVASGVTLAALTTQYYQRDYFWKYKVVQTTPTSFTIYTAEFDYLRKAEVRYNSTNNGWETIYTNSNVYSYSFRDDILEQPSLYQ